jgi:hypothetical protein
VQQLHLVGTSNDSSGLVFSLRKGAKNGRFVLPLDETLLAAVADAIRQRNGSGPATTVTADELLERPAPPPPPRRESGLNPREMQARLRAGRSIEQVAKEAGVEPSWVQRFAVPILAEQSLVLERAVQLAMDTARRGPSAYPLAAAVRRNLVERSVPDAEKVAEQGWSAHQENDDIWVVRFRYRSRGREQTAVWEADLGAGTLVARNRAATDLGYVAKSRRRAAPATDSKPAARSTKKAASKKAPAPKKKAATPAKKTAGAKKAPARRTRS